MSGNAGLPHASACVLDADLLDIPATPIVSRK